MLGLIILGIILLILLIVIVSNVKVVPQQVIDFPPRMEWIKQYLLVNLKKQGNIAELEVINNNYLFNIFNIWAIGLFFYGWNSCKLVFRVARMGDKKTVEWSGREMIDCINHFSMLHFKGHNSHFPLKK